MATLFVVIAGIGIAYLLAMKKFPGKDLLDTLFTLPLVLPPTVIGYYLIVLFGRNGLLGRSLYAATGFSIMFTWYAAVLASFVVALPLMIKTSRAAMESIDRNLVSASYTLGHSEFETFLKIILPLSKKGILAGTVLSFARAMGEFGATLMIAGNIPGKDRHHAPCHLHLGKQRRLVSGKCDGHIFHPYFRKLSVYSQPFQ